VMFDLPRMVEADLVREHDLIERFLEKSKFIVFVPGTRELMFVEDAEFHSGEESTSRLPGQ
jgi:hypothetical protein